MGLRCQGRGLRAGWSRGGRGTATRGAGPPAKATSSASVVSASASMTPPWTRSPEQPGGAAAGRSSATCEHRTRPSPHVVDEARHRRDDALEREDRPRPCVQLGRLARQAVAAVGAAGALDELAPSSAAPRCARGRRAAGLRPRAIAFSETGRAAVGWRPSSTSSRTPYSAFVVKIMRVKSYQRGRRTAGGHRASNRLASQGDSARVRASPVPLPAGGRGPRQRGERANCRRRRPVP